MNQTAFVHGVELSSGSVDMGRLDKKLTVDLHIKCALINVSLLACWPFTKLSACKWYELQMIKAYH